MPDLRMRDEFDLEAGLIYLNGGSHSICPRVVTDAVARELRAVELNPTGALFDAWARLWRVQRELAEFFGADPKDLFLRANVSEVLNALVLGAPLSPGGEILTTSLEYGAIVNLCRFRAQRDGRALRQLGLPATASENGSVTEDSVLESVVRELRPETRMLVISHIMTGTGLKIPLARLAAETRRRGVRLVVDGAHAPGAMPLDFKELSDVDFYGGNLHKWMMGPKGTAFGWVAPRHQESLQPIYAGWTTFETPQSFQDFGEGSRFQGKMLFSASRDFAPFFALHETLEFWKRLGPEKIFARIGELQASVENAVRNATGWERLSPPLESRGPLVAFELPAGLSAQGYGFMKRLLAEQRLQVALPQIQGRFQLRLSPHIWNSEEEIDRAAEILAAAG